MTAMVVRMKKRVRLATPDEYFVTVFNTNVHKVVEINGRRKLSCSQQEAFNILHRTMCAFAALDVAMISKRAVIAGKTNRRNANPAC